MAEYERNKPLTDEELNRILPAAGYEILQPPDGYIQPKLEVEEAQEPDGFQMQPEEAHRPYDSSVLPADSQSEIV